MSIATLDINLNSIYKNLTLLRSLSTRSVETAVVVKANAYGLGIKPVAQFLFDKGVRTFFVSTVTEAMELRQLIPPNSRIFYLNGYSTIDSQAIDEFDIMPILNSIEQIENFKRTSKHQNAGLQVDIGLSRLGLSSCDVLKANEICKSINLTLILGHLSSADDISNPTNLKQLDSFLKLSSVFRAVPRSLAATGGTILGKKYHFDMTRPGIGIFGGKPLENAEQVVAINLPILQIKDIKKNDGVGYNHTFISKTSKKIAIVGSGYADGLSRQLSNEGRLFAGGIPCPILGRVSMDLITVDVTHLEHIPTSLSVLSPFQSIDDLADQCHTIGYEILTSLGSRYKRVYHY